MNGGGQLKAQESANDLIQHVNNTNISESTPTSTTSTALDSHNRSKILLNKVKGVFNDSINYASVEEHLKASAIDEKMRDRLLEPGDIAIIRSMYTDWLDKLNESELDKVLKTYYKVVPKMTSGLFTKW